MDKSSRTAYENQRKKTLDRAKELGIRVTDLARLFELLGLDVPTAGASRGP